VFQLGPFYRADLSVTLGHCDRNKTTTHYVKFVYLTSFNHFQLVSQSAVFLNHQSKQVEYWLWCMCIAYNTTLKCPFEILAGTHEYAFCNFSSYLSFWITLLNWDFKWNPDAFFFFVDRKCIHLKRQSLLFLDQYYCKNVFLSL
jgi:hypothetical protein